MVDNRIKLETQVRIILSQRLQGNMIPFTEEQMMIFNENCLRHESSDSGKDDVPNMSDDIQAGSGCREKEAQVSSNNAVSQPDGSSPSKYQTKIAIALDESTRHSNDSGSYYEDEVFEDSIEIIVNDKIIHFTAKDLIPNDYDEYDDGDDEDTKESSAYDTVFEEEGLVIIECEEDDTDVPHEVRDDISQAYSDVTDIILSAVYYSTESIKAAFCRTPTSKRAYEKSLQ